jgi:type VI secretion system protein ImpC
MLDPDFTALLEREFTPVGDRGQAAVEAAVERLTEQALAHPELVCPDPKLTIEAIVAEIDLKLGEQINLILHHPEFQQMEAAWRGLYFLVDGTETDAMVKIKLFNISKRELGRVLRNFRGTAWDQSPIFKRIYEAEYGQLGGEPYGLLVGDYYFDHSPADVQLLADIAQTAAAAHAPFIAGAAPSLTQMESWAELANPRDLSKIFQTPEYIAWRSMRESEDARYLGLALPRFLARLPYGARTDPLRGFVFDEDAEGPDASHYLWTNSAYAMAANVIRAFSLYGWCTRIRGVDGGGLVEGIPVLTFPTADGEVDCRCVTEIALGERHEAELARNGLMPLLHLKNTGAAAFFGAQSLQKPEEYEDPAATANASLSARLPYLFACCRFAHYLKCMVRDKIGRSMSKDDLTNWLQDWLNRYVDGSPDTSSEAWKAAHPLAMARVDLEDDPEKPGQYNAKFLLKPHYQLEGLSVALRLVSRA